MDNQLAKEMDLIYQRDEALAKRKKRQEDETLVSHALYQRFGRPATAREIRGFLDGTAEEQERIWYTGLPKPGPRTEGSNAVE